MGQYTIKDIQDQAELLKADVQRIYRSLYTKLGFFPKRLDQVPYYIITKLYPSPTKEPLTITPSTEQQEFTTPENIKYDPIIVNGVTSGIDGNITPENIKEGVSILGVAGTLSGGGNAKPEEVFDVQPTTAEQIIDPTKGSVFSSGIVRAVTSSIDGNIQPVNIKEGVSILGVVGTLKEEKPEESFDVQPTTADQTITPTAGSVFSGGTVHAVTSAIDSNIQPENIKEGVSILGVAGTLSGGGGSDVFVVPPETRFGWSKFTEIPSNWDFSEFSNEADMSYLFYKCENLTTIPQIDLSSAQIASYLFYNCKNLTTVPELNLSNANNVSYLFYNCSKLTTVPELNLSNANSVAYLFYNCSKLTTVPELNLSNANSVTQMFAGCDKLTTVPRIDTSKATDMSYLFASCYSLETVNGIDFSGLTENLTNLFGWATSMSIKRFIVNGKINVSISDDKSIKALTKIDYDSVKSILAAADRTDNTNAKTLAFNRTMADQNGELAALVASCTTKGWTITGLTLQ